MRRELHGETDVRATLEVGDPDAGEGCPEFGFVVGSDGHRSISCASTSASWCIILDIGAILSALKRPDRSPAARRAMFCYF